MTLLLLIILLLFLLFGWPLLRGWLYMRSLRQRVDETFRGGQQQSRSRTSNYADDEDSNGDSSDWQQNDKSHRSRKIYTDSDGEYAEFEEIAVTREEQTTDNNQWQQTVVEEQIVDVEFEEIN